MPAKPTQDYLKDLDVVELLVPITFTRGLAGKSVGAHYCYDPRAFDGIVVPTSRRVVKRTPDGPVLSQPVVPSRLYPRSSADEFVQEVLRFLSQPSANHMDRQTT